MLDVEHRHQDDAIKKGVDSAVRLILGNQRGSYLHLPVGPASRYDGFFIYDVAENQMYKVLEPFDLGIARVTNRMTSLETDKGSFWMNAGVNSLVIAPKKAIDLIFDFRKSYDSRVWGRYYSLAEEKGKIIVEYIKRTDSKEDPSDGEEEFRFFAVIMHDGSHMLKGSWVRREYGFDKDRASQPFERDSYHAATVNAKRVVISAAKRLEDALAEAEVIFTGAEPEEAQFHPISDRHDVNFAYNNAVNSLSNLRVNNGILAGFPWFFQFWTRDEAISAGALISMEKYEEAKKMLFRETEHILGDGRIANQLPSGGLGSADSTGWCFLRLKELAELGRLNKIEGAFLAAKSDYILPRFNPLYFRDNLVWNNAKETWMDTDVDGNDNRAGARIEIQAMHIACNKMLYELTGQVGFRDVAQGMLDKVRKEFWDGRALADGLGDYTQRPNIFIAYYACPELLTKAEWDTCFDTALSALWLDWGGLSTIDKGSKWFCPEHTGENNRSYHRGDSWYWINNLAAVCLQRHDSGRYAYYIKKILDASTKELLWVGAIGSMSELSSASRQESRGCFSQAWSLATYIELVNEINSTKIILH